MFNYVLKRLYKECDTIHSYGEIKTLGNENVCAVIYPKEHVINIFLSASCDLLECKLHKHILLSNA